MQIIRQFARADKTAHWNIIFMFRPDERRGAIGRQVCGTAADVRAPSGALSPKPEISALCVPALRCPAFAGRPKRQARNNPATPGALKILRSRRGSNYRPAVGVRAGSRVTCKTENAGNVGVVRPGATVSGAPAQALQTRREFLPLRSRLVCPAGHRPESAALGWCNSRFSSRFGLRF